MNRLTKKIDGVYYILPNTNSPYEKIFDGIQKLGKLEDLEEQLGCPLKVVFKALEEGIIDYEGKKHIVVYTGKHLVVVEHDKLQHGFHTKNYKKTWWLKGEKPNE